MTQVAGFAVANGASGLIFPKVLGLYAPLPQSGKSTVTAFLEVLGAEHHLSVLNIKISAPLKEPLLRMGLCHEHIEGALKEVPLDILGGRSPREVMIECYKQGVRREGPDWLANQARTRIRKALAHGHVVVVDDVRTPADFAMLREFGADAKMWRVVRPTLQRPDGADHIEGLLEKHTFDLTVVNDSTFEALGRKVAQALTRTVETARQHPQPRHGNRVA